MVMPHYREIADAEFALRMEHEANAARQLLTRLGQPGLHHGTVPL